jgi:hypothetical protein
MAALHTIACAHPHRLKRSEGTLCKSGSTPRAIPSWSSFQNTEDTDQGMQEKVWASAESSMVKEEKTSNTTSGQMGTPACIRVRELSVM